MKQDKESASEAILIGVVIAVVTCICTGLVDEIRYRWQLERERRKRKKKG